MGITMPKTQLVRFAKENLPKGKSVHRRFKQFLIRDEALLGYLNVGYQIHNATQVQFPIFEPLPEDANVVHTSFDSQYQQFSVVVTSELYKDVPPFNKLPMEPNGLETKWVQALVVEEAWVRRAFEFIKKSPESAERTALLKVNKAAKEVLGAND